MGLALTGYGLLVSAWMQRELTRAEGAILRERTHRLAELFAQQMEAQFRSRTGGIADYAAALRCDAPPTCSRVCKEARGPTGPCPAGGAYPARGAPPVARHRHARPRDRRDARIFLGGPYFTRAFQQGTTMTPTELPNGATPLLTAGAPFWTEKFARKGLRPGAMSFLLRVMSQKKPQGFATCD